MIDWDGKRRTIAAKIEAVGSPATLNRVTSAYDGRLDETVEIVEAIPCFALMSVETSTDDEGRLVSTQVATITEAPATGDDLVIAGKSYVVNKAIAVAPGGVPILWSAVIET